MEENRAYKGSGHRLKGRSRLFYMILIGFCILILFGSISRAESATNRNVLVLNSYHRGYKWSDDIIGGIDSFFEAGNENVKLYIEYMDTKRISDAKYFQQLYGIYKHKFRNFRFDVIISSDDNAFNFLRNYRNEIFPGTPVVFCGVNDFKPSQLEGHDLFTGVNEQADFRANIEIALKMHPDTKQIVVINDRTTTGLKIHEELMKIIPDYQDSVKFIFLEDIEMEKIQEKLQGLSPNSLAFYTSFYQDRSGKFFEYDESISLIAKACNVPIYGVWDMHLGYGLVGGMLTSGHYQGEAAAKIALRLLRGEKVSGIHVIKESPNRYMFDYNQLDRFGIKPSKLPGDSIVINKPYSLYSKHRKLVWGAIASIAGLTSIIFILFFNIMKRKRAEEKLKKTHDELEQRVIERTKDLDGINKKLNLELTERKLAEKSLQRTQEELETMMDSVPAFIAYKDTNNRYIRINKSYADFINLPRESIEGKSAFDIAKNHDLAETYWRDDKKVIDSGIPKRNIIERFVADETRWLRTDKVPYMDEHGNIIGVIAFFVDITSLLETEEALRESEEQYRLLAENLTDVIWTMDMNMRYTYFSPSVERVRGYTPEEAIAQSIEKSMTPASFEKAVKIFNEAMEMHYKGESDPNRSVIFELELTCKDGSTVWTEVQTSFIYGPNNQPIGVIGTTRDITDRKLAEEGKKRLEAQLVYAQRMESVGTLAGGIAHNFNNLLMGIQGNVSIILLDIDSSHQHHRYLMNIEKQVKSGSKLTTQLLGYAREGRYETKPISLNHLGKETSDTFGLAKKEIEVHQEFAENLFGIEADQGQIEQLLMNLFVNAADAMPRGGDLFLKTMNVTNRDMRGKPYEPKPGRYVLLTVRDTGAGMDRKTMDRIFEPFFTTKGLARGTGLGMASVYGIIKGHGGYIDVDSEKGHGTTFSIYLPATEKRIKKEKRLPVDLVKGKETVLLVEDEEIVLDAGEQMLKTLGYEVLSAGGGQEALELYKKNQGKIDMVLLDMVMPGMGGGETYDRMKEVNPEIKVLLSSGYSIDGQATEILKRGCNGFIQKPFNMKQLSQKLREILDKE